jgi:hypothetical protein
MLSYLRARYRRSRGPRQAGGVRPARDVISAENAGLSVLLDLRRDIYFTLDEVGTLIWQEIESGRGAECAARRVCEEYDAPADVAQEDVERFVADLVSRGLAVRA